MITTFVIVEDDISCLSYPLQIVLINAYFKGKSMGPISYPYP